MVLGIISVQSSLPICKQKPLREQRLRGLWKEQIYIIYIREGWRLLALLPTIWSTL